MRRYTLGEPHKKLQDALRRHNNEDGYELVCRVKTKPPVVVSTHSDKTVIKMIESLLRDEAQVIDLVRTYPFLFTSLRCEVNRPCEEMMTELKKALGDDCAEHVAKFTPHDNVFHMKQLGTGNYILLQTGGSVVLYPSIDAKEYLLKSQRDLKGVAEIMLDFVNDNGENVKWNDMDMDITHIESVPLNGYKVTMHMDSRQKLALVTFSHNDTPVMVPTTDSAREVIERQIS